MRGLWLGLLFAAAAYPQAARSRPFRLEELKTPPGFQVDVYARVAGGPRHMAFGPNGVLYVAARAARTVVAVPEAGRTITVLSGLNGPHSLAFRGTDLYVSVNDGVLRFRDAVSEEFVIRSGAERVAALPAGGGHTTRTIGFGPDGKLYATAGSSCNFCLESDPRRAAMMRFETEGGEGAVYAAGLRNTVGFAWHPVTGELWSVDNGGDGLGDDEPPEEINIIRQGADYGWPDCAAQRRPVNWGVQARTGRCGSTAGPELEMQAHSAPLGIAFYTGFGFPASWTNDALVAFHGSWNRSQPSGYKVSRVRAASGRAAGIEDFLWGFLDPETRSAAGRPVHAIAGPDGAVYVSEGSGGYILRVSYHGPLIYPGGIIDRGSRIYELYGAALAQDPARFSLTANGRTAELLFVSPGQVNFRLPEGLSGEVAIAVQNEVASDIAHISVP